MPNNYGPMKRAPHDPSQIVMANEEAKSRGLIHAPDASPRMRELSNTELMAMAYDGGRLPSGPVARGFATDLARQGSSVLSGLLSPPGDAWAKMGDDGMLRTIRPQSTHLLGRPVQNQ